jgi:hypothetical protein
MEATNLIRGSRTARRRSGSWLTPLGRYLFGPGDPAGLRTEAILAEIDRLDGLVVPADIMRVTGLDRVDSEALLCKLAARHGGDVGVSGTAVLYTFPRLLAHSPRLIARRATPGAVWDQPGQPQALTGNEAAVDFALLLANLLVLAASALGILLTLSASAWVPALGVLSFALALFALALPAARALNRRAYLTRLAAENGRRGLVRVVLQRRLGSPVSAHALSHAWVAASGRVVGPRRLRAEVSALGGEPDLDEAARLAFRFPDLDHEGRAVAQLRR